MIFCYLLIMTSIQLGLNITRVREIILEDGNQTIHNHLLMELRDLKQKNWLVYSITRLLIFYLRSSHFWLKTLQVEPKLIGRPSTMNIFRSPELTFKLKVCQFYMIVKI